MRTFLTDPRRTLSYSFLRVPFSLIWKPWNFSQFSCLRQHFLIFFLKIRFLFFRAATLWIHNVAARDPLQYPKLRTLTTITAEIDRTRTKILARPYARFKMSFWDTQLDRLKNAPFFPWRCFLSPKAAFDSLATETGPSKSLR